LKAHKIMLLTGKGVKLCIPIIKG